MNSIEHTTIATLAPTVAHRRAVAVVDLCSGLSPMWGLSMSTSRAQFEFAVTQMRKAFADIGPLIDMAERQSAQVKDALAQPVDGIEGWLQRLESQYVMLEQRQDQKAAGTGDTRQDYYETTFF